MLVPLIIQITLPYLSRLQLVNGNPVGWTTILTLCDYPEEYCYLSRELCPIAYLTE